MDETQIQTLEDVEQFLAGTTGASLQLQGGKDDVYEWIERTLVRLFRYLWLCKKQKTLVRHYIGRLSGYSSPQMDRLIVQYRRTGHIRRRQRTVKGFETKYTKADITLLADVDRIVDDASGTMVKAFCQRMYEVYGDQRFVVVTVARISEQFMLPALRALLHQFPFLIEGFHADKKAGLPFGRTGAARRVRGMDTPNHNGSEQINHKVAELLNDLMIRLTKSRSRHSNECVACPRVQCPGRKQKQRSRAQNLRLHPYPARTCATHGHLQSGASQPMHQLPSQRKPITH